MYKNDKVIRRYSEPFKLKILDELSTGKHTKSELCKLYSIAPTTVNEWINMLTLRKKTSCRTTNSYHRFYKYNNMIKDMEVTRSNQVWVSDITYIRTVKGFCYLALITDMHSRKIVGYDLSDSLELKGCVRALNKAICQAKNIRGLVHHSDRGIQYCSNVYTQILKRNKINISMT
jgi:transposase InsO family protein